MTDVLIVGAGPAGLLAARELVTLGKSVLVIEKNSDMGILNRACSMQFILDEDYEGEGVVIGYNELIFPKSGFSVPYNGKLVPVNNKYYHSPKNHLIRFARENGKVPFSYKFNKQQLLKDLYDECVKLGVEFRLGAFAVNGYDTGDHVEIEVRSGSSTETLSGKKLIIAEGVNASLCEKFGMNNNRMHIATALCVKYIVEGITGIENNSWNLYYGSTYHSNAAVIIGPSLYGDDICEVTITGDKLHKPDDIYKLFTTDSPMAKHFASAKLIKKMACSVKAFNAMSDPCNNNVIAIGDSAAMVEVEVQGAFLCGYHASKAVIAELEGTDGWSSYREWWQQSFEFNSDDYMRVSQGYALVPVYADDELDYLFGLIEDRCLYGTYSQYKTPKLIWDSIHEHDEKIKAERPEIFEKMLKMNQMSLSDSFSK